MNSRYYSHHYEQIYHTYLDDFDVTPYLSKQICSIGPAPLLIDFGCGVGTQLCRIASHLDLDNKRILGIDNSSKMLNLAKRRLPNATFANEHLGNGDAITLRVAEFIDSADKQFSSIVLLCLGNTIGLLSRDERASLGQAINSIKNLCEESRVRFKCYLEYRDSSLYKNEHTKSIEVLGGDSNFVSFYIRSDQGEDKYSVHLISIAIDKSAETLDLFHGFFDTGYYVDGASFRNFLIKIGLSVKAIDKADLASGLAGGTFLEVH